MKLANVARVLFSWVDFFYSKVDSDAEDILPGELHFEMRKIFRGVKNAYCNPSLDFSAFRLSLFTNLISALQIVKPGKHLHQFFLPCDGTAALHHLNNPYVNHFHDLQKHQMNLTAEESSTVNNLMQMVSTEMRWPWFRRNKVEVYLCESMSGRCLNKKDLFFNKQSIFFLPNEGHSCFRKFGKNSSWQPCEAPNKKLAFLQ